VNIRVILRGFSEGQAKLSKAEKAFKKTVGTELKKLGDECIAEMQLAAYASAFGPPKARDDGKPPLIDTQEYIDSYRARIEGETTLVITAEGENAKMSNEALGEILEYGRGPAGFGGPAPPRPHQRVLRLKIERRLETGVTGKKIFAVLLGR
jgi:hypothetical protein